MIQECADLQWPAKCPAGMFEWPAGERVQAGEEGVCVGWLSTTHFEIWFPCSASATHCSLACDSCNLIWNHPSRDGCNLPLATSFGAHFSRESVKNHLVILVIYSNLKKTCQPQEYFIPKPLQFNRIIELKQCIFIKNCTKQNEFSCPAKRSY